MGEKIEIEISLINSQPFAFHPLSKLRKTVLRLIRFSRMVRFV